MTRHVGGQQPWGWADIQACAVARGVDDWSVCPACGLRVLQRVGSLHIYEEHPEVAAGLGAAAARCQRCGGAGMIDLSIIDNEYAAESDWQPCPSCTAARSTEEDTDG